MQILINAFGIRDSGGIVVFQKLLNELQKDKKNTYILICNQSPLIDNLASKFKHDKNFHFHIIHKKNIIYRLYYENIKFIKIIKSYDIKLIYNFSGSNQLFINNVPQLSKIHNLLFFSRKLDLIYQSKHQYLKWFKDIVIKRMIILLMLNKSKNIEVQSEHVIDHLNKFLDINNKSFYLKSDISIKEKLFLNPKNYDFKNQIKFLFIVGPHFKSPHKNLKDFSEAMTIIQSNKKINFQIDITLTEKQLLNFEDWNNNLNCNTNFLGYLPNNKVKNLYTDNTILISTSIVETLGLHVIEAIQSGVITIVPNEDYAETVYGSNVFKYELFSGDSLNKAIMRILNHDNDSIKNIIEDSQRDIKIQELNKKKSILDIFKEILDV